MANGFISSNNMLEKEDIGNEAWNELYQRSFFQDIETDIFGKITSIKICTIFFMILLNQFQKSVLHYNRR